MLVTTGVSAESRAVPCRPLFVPPLCGHPYAPVHCAVKATTPRDERLPQTGICQNKSVHYSVGLKVRLDLTLSVPDPPQGQGHVTRVKSALALGGPSSSPARPCRDPDEWTVRVVTPAPPPRARRPWDGQVASRARAIEASTPGGLHVQGQEEQDEAASRLAHTKFPSL